jgi:hypothetical protein
MRRGALLDSLTGQASLWQVDRLFPINVALDVALVQGIVQRSTGAAHNCKIPLGGVKARPLPSNVAAPPKSDRRACTPYSGAFYSSGVEDSVNAGFRAANVVLQWRPYHAPHRVSQDQSSRPGQNVLTDPPSDSSTLVCVTLAAIADWFAAREKCWPAVSAPCREHYCPLA